MKDLEQISKYIDNREGRNGQDVIGFYGQPSQQVMDLFCTNGFSFIDLDVPSGAGDCGLVPEVYCYIIREIVNNAIKFRNQLRLVICTTGPDKCDQGMVVKELLDNLGIPTLDASNCQKEPIRPALISTSSGPLRQRVERIMELCHRPLSSEEIKYYDSRQCEPKANFHGVPPADTSILDLFPDQTHIHGWTRLVELGIPSRIDIEYQVDNKAPTIFYTQSFCHKALMAKYLSEQTDGLFVDLHGSATNSIKIKIEAFIKLKAEKNKKTTSEKNKEMGKKTA